jgi:hypothetical protein
MKFDIRLNSEVILVIKTADIIFSPRKYNFAPSPGKIQHIFCGHTFVKRVHILGIIPFWQKKLGAKKTTLGKIVHIFGEMPAVKRGEEFIRGFCPGKLTLEKILSEISGQYFYRGFKPRDRIFPAVFKESSISSIHGLKI